MLSFSRFFFLRKKGITNYTAIRGYYAAPATNGEANDSLCTNTCINLFSLAWRI
jgi:hypothetical protein